MENINNSSLSASEVESFDFSTLYTMFDHTALINNINWCFDKAYNNHDRAYINLDKPTSKFAKFDCARNKSFSFNLHESKLLHSWLVRNTFITCGNIVLRQDIGVPIGVDQAPFQANLALHKDEFAFISKLIQLKEFSIAKAFNSTFRFLDDTNALNNHGYFNLFKNCIYSEGLVINKENTGTQSSTMLELDISIINKRFHCSLYDKRDKFGFPIVKYPSSDSNIHSATVYNTFITQIIRFGRVCNNLNYFLLASASLFKTMLSKGCKKRILLRKFFSTLSKPDKKLKVNLIEKFNSSSDISFLRHKFISYLK